MSWFQGFRRPMKWTTLASSIASKRRDAQVYCQFQRGESSAQSPCSVMLSRLWSFRISASGCARPVSRQRSSTSWAAKAGRVDQQHAAVAVARRRHAEEAELLRAAAGGAPLVVVAHRRDRRGRRGRRRGARRSRRPARRHRNRGRGGGGSRRRRRRAAPAAGRWPRCGGRRGRGPAKMPPVSTRQSRTPRPARPGAAARGPRRGRRGRCRSRGRG